MAGELLSQRVLDVYNFAVSLGSALGLLYLLYSGRFVVNYRRFFEIIALGMLAVLFGGTFVYFASNASRHAIHGTATLVIAVGLFDLVRRELPGQNVDWTVVLRPDAGEFGMGGGFDPGDPDEGFEEGDTEGFEGEDAS